MAYRQQGFKARMSSIFYVHTEAFGACMMAFAALIELACAATTGDEYLAMWIAYPAAGVFASVALCMVWSIIRFERRHGVQS